MATDLKDKVAFCLRNGAGESGELVLGWEGLGFEAEAGGQGLEEVRQTKGSRGFSEQGHQAKAQRNQSPLAKRSRASEPSQSSGAVCKQTQSTRTHPTPNPTKHPQNIPLGFRTLIRLSDYPLEAQGNKYRCSEFTLSPTPVDNGQSMWGFFPNRAKVGGQHGD